MRVTQVAGPAAEPITLSEARAHLRVDGTAEDALIALYLTAAREDVEAETGRCIMPQDWLLRLPAFPGQAGRIVLEHAPLMSVTVLATVDTANVATIVSASLYDVYAPAGAYAPLGHVVPKPGFAWPVLASPAPDAVRVTYRAGYAEPPDWARAAILLRLGDLYANREAAGTARVTDNPTIDRLLSKARLAWPDDGVPADVR